MMEMLQNLGRQPDNDPNQIPNPNLQNRDDRNLKVEVGDFDGASHKP